MTSTSALNICGVTLIHCYSSSHLQFIIPTKKLEKFTIHLFWHLGTKLGEKLGTNIIMHIMEVHSHVRSAYTAHTPFKCFHVLPKVCLFKIFLKY